MVADEVGEEGQAGRYGVDCVAQEVFEAAVGLDVGGAGFRGFGVGVREAGSIEALDFGGVFGEFGLELIALAEEWCEERGLGGWQRCWLRRGCRAGSVCGDDRGGSGGSNMSSRSSGGSG